MLTDFCSTDSTEGLLYIDKHRFAIKNDRYSTRIKVKIVPTPVLTCRHCETYFRRRSSCDFDLEKQFLHKSNVFSFYHFIDYWEKIVVSISQIRCFRVILGLKVVDTISQTDFMEVIFFSFSGNQLTIDSLSTS